MKKIIIFTVLFMFLFSSISIAEINLIEQKKILEAGFSLMQIEVYCINGYKWVVVRSGNGDVSIKQMWRKGAFNSTPPQPVECK